MARVPVPSGAIGYGGPTATQESTFCMAKPNYQFEKRQRELEKKRKKEEKAQKKSSSGTDKNAQPL